MRKFRFFLFTILSLGFLVASVAQAHLDLMDPPNRYGGDELKDYPCGIAGATRSANVTTLEPGATITVRWNEYTNHPGHYRIAFDDDGDDDFMDPPCLSDCDSRDMVIGIAPGDYTDPTVLADGIADMDGGIYTYDVTLPDIECDNCTLQVIQFMTDKPPFGAGGGRDLYYQCADLVLERGAGGDGGVIVMDSGMGGTDTGTPGADTGTPVTDTGTGGTDTGSGGSDTGSGGEDDGGCSVAHSSNRAPFAGFAALFALLAWRRRR